VVPPPESPDLEPSDHDLMARLAAGESRAFDALAARWRPRLVNYFRSLGADVHGAEDCAQETLIRVHAYRAAYRPQAEYAAFLFTVARHAFLDWRRRVVRREAHEVAATGAAATGDAAPGRASADADDPGARTDLAAAVLRLPPRLRGVVELAAIRGLPYDQVATLLGIPVGTVKSRMHLAVRRLRETLGDGVA
jgi:RNA polymerase sigma-70 factor (ECF subfamily)